MIRQLFYFYRVNRKAVNLIAILLVSVYVLSGFAIARANPIVIYELQGIVHIMENGTPSDKVDSVTLECQYSIFGEVIIVEDDGTSHSEYGDIPQTFTEIWPCQNGECPFETELMTAGGPVSCKWVVITPDGATIANRWEPDGLGFVDVYIDISTGFISVKTPTPPATGTPEPIGTSMPEPITPASKGPTVLPGLRTFLAALILAWLVEVPVVFLMLRFVFKPRYGDTKRLLGAGLLATLVTLPLAWYALPFIRLVISLDPWAYIALVETLVVIVEALIFERLLRIPVWKAALVSLLANGLSFLVGLAVL